MSVIDWHIVRTRGNSAVEWCSDVLRAALTRMSTALAVCEYEVGHFEGSDFDSGDFEGGDLGGGALRGGEV